MSAKELSDKQQRFVDEYCIDLNATQACIRSGYSPKTSDKLSYQLLVNPRVKAAIEKKQAEIALKHDIKREDIIASVKNKQRANILDYAEWKKNNVKWKPSSALTREQGARIKSLSMTINNAGHRAIKLELHDSLQADKLLAQLSGEIVERREHSGLGGKAIEHKHGVELDLTKLTSEDIKELKRISELAKPSEDKK
jgi:phage terminase small subunit